MLQWLKDKIKEKQLNKIQENLRNTNYTELKHDIMAAKWQALRENDDDAYEAIEEYEKMVETLEKIFG